MIQFPGDLKSFAPASPAGPVADTQRVGYVDGAISQGEIATLSGLFPNVIFESVGPSWPQRLAPETEILIAGASAALHDVEQAVNFLKARHAGLHVLIALRNADVASSRVLTRAGAAEVIPLPASETAWALAMERLLSRETARRDSGRKAGQVVALLKAGGGVGATALGVQAAQILADGAGEGANICFADLDLQFGNAALYLDLEEALTVTDCVAVGELLEETQFATVLAAHKSGMRVLAAPRDVTVLDALTPKLVDGLVMGLRRDFALTILDLPSVWTAWTNRALQLADRIILVTQLSVAHVHLARRQLGVLAMQKLDGVPLTLACNAVSGEQQDLLGLKAAERAIGRPFDIILPEDRRAMGGATNQGRKLSEVRRGTKLEKQVALLADRIAADALAPVAMKR